MWPGFEELRRLEQSEDEGKKSKKRKSIDKNCRQVHKRHRRSLFDQSHIQKHHGGASCSFRPVNDNNIGMFSSDEEETLCHQDKLGSFVGASKKSSKTTDHGKFESLNKTKCNEPSKLAKHRNQSTSFISKSEDCSTLIKWSDSDSDNDVSSKHKQVKEGVENDQVLIGIFESPVKADSNRMQFTCGVSVDKCKLAPLTTAEQEELAVTHQNDTSNFIPKPVDSSKKKRCKDVKGGLLEQLKRLAARERSDVAFWKHSLSEEILDVPEKRIDERHSLTLKLLQKQNEFSLTMLTCCAIENHSKTVTIILPDVSIAEYKLENGDIIKIYSPYKRLHVRGTEHPIILCSYFIKVLSGSLDGTDVNQALNDFEERGVKTPESQESYVNSSFSSSIDCSSKSNFTTIEARGRFSQCKLLQPLSFVASVIKSSITTKRHSIQFPADSDRSVIDSLSKAVGPEALELFLIIHDLDGQVASLTQTLFDRNAAQLCWQTVSEGKLLLFKNFILKNIKSISFDSTISTCLKNYGLNTEGKHPGDVYYLFAESNESLISLWDGDTVSKKCSIEKPSMIYSSQFQRLTFYAYCVCIVPGIHCENPSSSKNFTIIVVKCGNVSRDEPADNNLQDSCNSVLFSVEKLPTCYIPRFVTKSILEKDRVFLLQDVLQNVETKHCVLDKLSKILLVQCKSSIEIPEVDFDIFYGTKLFEGGLGLVTKPSLHLKELALDCLSNTIVMVKGCISGIIEESAMFWTVCNDCGLETNQPVIEKTFFCFACKTHVNKRFHVHLDVILHCENIPDVQITVSLLEKTVFEYLPMEITEDFKGYDVDCIIGKTFGKKICFISSVNKNSFLQREQSFVGSINLKEVNTADGIENLLDSVSSSTL